MKTKLWFVAALVPVTIAIGCGKSDLAQEDQGNVSLRSVTLHIDGFTKSKSGAT